MHPLRRFLLIALLSVVSSSAFAQVFQLTFEGLQGNEEVQNFYNGGTGSLGSSGVNYGVSFSAGTLASIDSEAGGTGNFANEPSPSTIIFWLAGPSVIMDVAAGFTTGFSFVYTSSAPMTVTVYDGLGGTGNVLGTTSGPAQSTGGGCTGDPTGTFCNWSQLGVSFSGTARSVVFSGLAGQTGYDNITFGNSVPVLPARPVPTLSEWGMIILSSLMALGTIAVFRRRNG